MSPVTNVTGHNYQVEKNFPKTLVLYIVGKLIQNAVQWLAKNVTCHMYYMSHVTNVRCHKYNILYIFGKPI